MARARGFAAPRLSPLALSGLSEVPLAEEATADGFEGVRFASVARDELRLGDTSIVECEFSSLHCERVDAHGTRLADVRFSDVDVVEWRGRESSWRDVEVGEGRIGSIDLSNAELSGITITDLRVGYAGLHGAELSDVLFRGCRFSALDLPEATLTRVRFEDCVVDEFDLRQANCSSLDIRGLEVTARFDLAGRGDRPPLEGVWASSSQAAELAPVLARAVGLNLLD